MTQLAARFFDVFVPGTYDRIAVFGPESPRTLAFRNQSGVAAQSVFRVDTDEELARLDNGIPLVLLPKWWQSGASAPLISAARSTEREILIAFP
jgi:hypothetical protein